MDEQSEGFGSLIDSLLAVQLNSRDSGTADLANATLRSVLAYTKAFYDAELAAESE